VEKLRSNADINVVDRENLDDSMQSHNRSNDYSNLKNDQNFIEKESTANNDNRRTE